MIGLHSPQVLNCDDGPRIPRSRAIEKQPHPQRLCPLCSHQPHLSADVIVVLQQRNLHLISRRVSVQPLDPRLDHFAKSGADLETILRAAVRNHAVLLEQISRAGESFSCVLKISPSWPMIATPRFSAQITAWRLFGNQVS